MELQRFAVSNLCPPAQIAQLADGFVVAREGGTVVMVSAVSNRREMDGSGFLPLSVDYREKVCVCVLACL